MADENTILHKAAFPTGMDSNCFNTFFVWIGCIFLKNELSDALNLIILRSILIAAIANSVVFYEKLLAEVADNLNYLLD